MRTNNKFGYGGVAFVIMLYLSIANAYSQTCTISGSGTISWNNSSPPSCIEGGVANDPGISIIEIPSSVNLDFNSNSDTWTGTSINVSGTLSITAPGQVTINSSIIVRSGGLLSIDSKLNLGPNTTGCGYSVVAESGSTLDIVSGSGASDRLSICGVVVAQGGGGCHPYPGGPLPYCEPTGGFPTPLGFDENGDNPTLLPVTLLFFGAVVGEKGIKLSWKTATELNNDFFTIERSKDGINFQSLGTIDGSGTTNNPQDYEFMDYQPYSGIS